MARLARNRRAQARFCAIRRKVIGHLWTVIVALAAGLIGIVESIDNNLKVPGWTRLTIFALGLVYGQFQAFHDVRVERDALIEDEAKRLARISRLFGTELREIRRKIEMAKATHSRSPC